MDFIQDDVSLYPDKLFSAFPFEYSFLQAWAR
jgi:hypothetical protein